MTRVNGITVVNCHPHVHPSLLYSVSIRQMAPPERGRTHTILLTAQFIDLGRMKG